MQIAQSAFEKIYQVEMPVELTGLFEEAYLAADIITYEKAALYDTGNGFELFFERRINIVKTGVEDEIPIFCKDANIAMSAFSCFLSSMELNKPAILILSLSVCSERRMS